MLCVLQQAKDHALPKSEDAGIRGVQSIVREADDPEVALFIRMCHEREAETEASGSFDQALLHRRAKRTEGIQA